VGQALPEIPLPVEERDSDQRQPKIAGGFGMVARKNAETTGVNWQSGVDAKLGGKIGDGSVHQLRAMLAQPGSSWVDGNQGH
jgi:hypothetical protein